MEKTRTIKEIRKDYVEAKAQSDIDLEQIPKTTRAGWAMRKSKAKDKVEALKKEALESFKVKSLGIFAVGAGGSVFAEVASSHAGTGWFSVEELYEDAAAEARASLTKTGMWTSSMHQMLQKWMRSQYIDMGLLHYKFPDAKTHKLAGDVVDYVKTLVRGVAGDSISLWQLKNFIIYWALSSASTVPAIVVTGVSLDEVEVLGSCFKNVVTVETPPDLTQEQALEKLAEVKSQLKRK